MKELYIIPEIQANQLNLVLPEVYLLSKNEILGQYLIAVEDRPFYERLEEFQGVFPDADKFFDSLDKVSQSETLLFIGSDGDFVESASSEFSQTGIVSVFPGIKYELIPANGERLLHTLEKNLLEGESPEQVAKKYKKKEAKECARALGLKVGGTEVEILSRIQEKLLENG